MPDTLIRCCRSMMPPPLILLATPQRYATLIALLSVTKQLANTVNTLR